MTTIEKSEIFSKYFRSSDETLKSLREAAHNTFQGNENVIVGVNGSVARGEYTSGSDVDYFILSNDSAPIDLDAFRRELAAKTIKMPADGGVFEDVLPYDLLLSPIGGQEDSNLTLTRRMLFLLEGECLYNQEAFDRLREQLIEKYVPTTVASDKFPLFLLNDIARYWRTICVDYEHKTSNANKAKAIRLAKLRMSRMLLCFSGMSAVAYTSGKPRGEKVTLLQELFSKRAIERLFTIYGDEFEEASKLYLEFLDMLDNTEIRAALDVAGEDALNTVEYRGIVELAQRFKESLIEILFNKFPSNGPVVKALIL